MGIQINGQTDTISAFDNNFSLAGNVSIGGFGDVLTITGVGGSRYCDLINSHKNIDNGTKLPK